MFENVTVEHNFFSLKKLKFIKQINLLIFFGIITAFCIEFIKLYMIYIKNKEITKCG